MRPRSSSSALAWTAVVAVLGIGLAGCTSAGSTGSAAGSATSAAVAPSTAAPAPASPAPVAGSLSKTVVVTLEPVRRSGALVAGWSAGPLDPSQQLDCTGASSSPAALSPAVMDCAPSAATADTCWASATAGQALCLQDPWSRRLARYAVSGALPTQVPAVAHADPLGLQLADGRHCRLRDGGSGEFQAGHPTWVEWYYCGGSILTSLWGPQDTGAPIDRSKPVWTVQFGSPTGTLTKVAVAKAFYVATAA